MAKDDALEDKVKKAVKNMTNLASEEGEQKVTGYLSKHTADTTNHKDLKKYHGKSVGDKKARTVAAKMMEIYHGKVRGMVDTYEGDTTYWLGFARRTLGDNYDTFLQQIKNGKISAATSLLENAIANEDLTTRAHGLAEGIYAMKPKDRLKWGEKMADLIGEDVDAQKLAENPVNAYQALRQTRTAQEAVRKPKPEPKKTYNKKTYKQAA